MANSHQQPLLEEQLTRSIIAAFYTVHRALGFGFREYIYMLAFERELILRGHQVEREVPVMVYYRGEPFAKQSVDMIVDGKVMVEGKATERLPPESSGQLFGYLCATTFEIGLLLHFGREPRPHRLIFENRFKAHSSHEQVGGGITNAEN